MKIQGRGRAKILSPEEQESLFKKGFKNARDRALYAVCCFSGCRISEARMLRYKDVFIGDSVRDVIILRKASTKGKQSTREIPCHPRLQHYLLEYVQHSRELLTIYQEVGKWDYKSLDCPDIRDVDGRLICPKCQSFDITTAGRSRDKQMFKCRNCSYRFQDRTVFMNRPDLRARLLQLGVYNSTSYGFLYLNPQNPYLFPGCNGQGYISKTTAQQIFQDACDVVKIEGSSTHSYRRTFITKLHRKNSPLRVIQRLSGHKRLKILQGYIEVTEEELTQAINTLPSFDISKVGFARRS